MPGRCALCRRSHLMRPAPLNLTAAQPPLPQVEGLTAYENVAGRRVLSTFGIDADRLTAWVVTLACLYPACLLMAFGALWWRTPRQHRGGGGGSGSHGCGGGVRLPRTAAQ